MPVSRSRKAPIHAEKPYEKSTSRRPKKSFGPISDQDPDIVAFDGVCAAREFNDARIASLLKTMVPCPRKKDWIQKTPSKSVSRPRFSSGKNGSELGRWYQVVSETPYNHSKFRSHNWLSAIPTKAYTQIISPIPWTLILYHALDLSLCG